MIHIVGVWNSVIRIKSVSRRKRFRMMPEMPLTHASRRVAKRLHMIGDRILVAVQSIVGLWKQNVTVHSDALWVAACQQSCARWRANRAGDIEACELATLGSHLIDVGSLDRLGPKAPEVVVSLVIGEDNDEVRLVFILTGK